MRHVKGESELTLNDARKEGHLSTTEANQMPTLQVSVFFVKIRI